MTCLGVFYIEEIRDKDNETSLKDGKRNVNSNYIHYVMLALFALFRSLCSLFALFSLFSLLIYLPIVSNRKGRCVY